MEMEQTTVLTCSEKVTIQRAVDDVASEALAACRQLTYAADAAIDQAYSGDAVTFLAANKQQGGE